MTGFNLPPGVSVSDLPGNSPAELAAEALSEAIYSQFPESLSAQECDKLEAWITTLIGKAYSEGYSQGAADNSAAHEDEIFELRQQLAATQDELSRLKFPDTTGR